MKFRYFQIFGKLGPDIISQKIYYNLEIYFQCDRDLVHFLHSLLVHAIF